MRVLVTGGTGFVGSHLVQHLSGCGVETICGARRPIDKEVPGRIVLIEPKTDFAEHLDGVDLVVHSAGVAHRSGDCEDEMMEGNARWTEQIVEAVAGSEVKALVHISSIAAEEAESAYGRSKLLAEEAVSKLQTSGKLAVNLRPPLIYGSGAKGNWPKLIKLAESPLPLPFGSVNNRRSFLGISNLCELIHSIVERLDQSNLSGTFPVADDDVVSLRDIVRALRAGLGRKEGLIPFPAEWLDGWLRKMGKSTMADGLFQDLLIDSSEVKEKFGWAPTRSTLDGMLDSMSSEKPVWI